MSRSSRLVVVLVTILSVLVPSLAHNAAIASASGNASLNLTKTVSGTSISPSLGLTLGIDKQRAIPGDTLTYTATVTNTGATLQVSGTFAAQNNGAVTATMADYYDDVEYYDKSQKAWAPLGGYTASQSGYTPVVVAPSSSGLALSATTSAASGVTYPASGNPILGTQIAVGSTANWSYVASLALTSSQVTLLSGSGVSDLRNVIHFEAIPRAASNGQPFTYRAEFSNPFQSQSAAVTNITVAITPPGGAATTFGASSNPALASLSPGSSAHVSVTYVVPAPAARGTAGDTDYLKGLQSLEGATLTANATASGSGAGGAVTAPTASTTTTEHVPILSITKSGPASAAAGTTQTYGISLSNGGGAAASYLAIIDALPDGSKGTVTGIPGSLAASASGSASASYPIAYTQVAGPLTDTASVTWQDAHGNSYGPVSSSWSTTVTNSYRGASLTLAPKTAGPDVTGTNQTVTATLVDSAGNPIANAAVTFSVTGPNQTSGTGTTDATGVATFQYSGMADGQDSVEATVTNGSVDLQSNTATVYWVTPVASVSTTSIVGKFFPNGGAYFSHTPADPPAFTQTFPTIDFNPPAGTINGTSQLPTSVYNVNVNTRPFTDVTTDLAGYYTGQEVAQGNGVQAGLGNLNSFDAVFTATFVVAQAGDIQFNFYSDDGFIFGVGGATSVPGPNTVNYNTPSTTPFQGYPTMGGYDDPTSPRGTPVTVHFPAPGEYAYEVDYSECCGGQLALTVANNQGGKGGAPAGTLALTPDTPPTQTVGQAVSLSVQAVDTSGLPIANLPVTLSVQAGPNVQAPITKPTDANGRVTFSYAGSSPGTDQVQVAANVNGMPAISNLVNVPWQYPSTSGGSGGSGFCTSSCPVPPTITDPSPAEGVLVTKPVPVTAAIQPPSGQTITSWKVTYQAKDPEPAVTLASGTGAPPSILATFDPTLLPNDTYAITVSATASGGGTQTVTTTVAVSGNLKLGHYVTTFQDLSVPVNGFQMEVQRTYDSYDKRVGDFGVGWRVDLSNFRVSANRQLGAGGWTEYPTQCILGLCYWGFKTSAPHYVTVTWPDGHQEVFDFTPKGGAAVFYWEGQAAFTARPGTDTTSTLEVDGDTGISYGFDGNIDAGDGSPYNPTRFQLTTHDGRVLILDVHSGLVSETDRSGNSLTVDSTGVHASNGESITYTRDGQNRITAISGPSGQSLSYTYDGNGDLSSSTDPDGNATTYAYTGDHLLTSITGPGQTRPFQQEVYDAATGRLTEVIDGDGNVTKVSNDVGARQQVVTDPAGKLTTVYSYDDLGDLIQRDQNFGGKTLTDTYTYDADGRPLSHTDPLGHTWAGVYDSAGDLTQVTSPASHSIAVSYDRFGNPLSVANPLGGNTSFSYDASGNLTGFTDALGHTETYSYDSAGNEVGRRDAAGNPWSGTYDSAGNLVSETDPLGHTTTYTYGVTGHMTSATDAHGNKTTYTYDAEGNLLSETDPLGHTTRWSYDSLGQVISKTDADGSITTYAYDGAGHLISTKDPLGHTTTNTYDADGRLASTTDPAGGVTSSTYDGAGRLATKTDPVGRITSYQYDDAGHLIKTTLPNGGTDTVTYDSEGHRVSETDAMGRTTSYSYDANGRLTGVTDPLGHKTTYQFDAIGQPVSITDALGQTTTQSFDALGRLVSVTDPTNGTATTMYDVAGRIVATKDALGRTTTFTYDSADRLVSTTDPAGHTTSYAYDAAGNQTSETDALGNTTTYTYDAMGRQVGVTDPLGHTTTTTYDGAGRQTSQTDARGATTHYAYDAAGNLTGLTDALGGTVSSTYDAAEQRTTLTDPLGRATHFTYDALGNVASETDPLGRITTSTYDLDGELTSRTDGRGDTATSSYDAAGHLTSTSSPGFSATYAYDALGRRTSMTGPSGTTTYIYDADGRVTTDASPQGTITYSYDAAGQRTEMTLPGARTITYTHDAASNLTGLADWAGHSVSFGYDANGRPTSITRPNGVTTSYGYDAAGNIVTLDHDGPGGPLGHYAYTYDAANNRTSVSSAAGTETYTLDALGRLIGVTYPGGHTSLYTYDDAGNRTSAAVGGTTTNATYDAAGELTSNGGTAYTYDGAGNLLTAGTSSFTWDGAGHLTNATVGGTASTYTYNGDGLRVSATTGGATTPYLWDSQDGMPALVDDGTNSYLQASGVQAQVDRSNAATYALDDALGSVRTLTDAAGTQVGAASYDAFGAVRSQTGTASIFGFTGQQTDPTGLLYLRARYLDPQLGQFLSADMLQPSGPGTQGYNRYTYVGDNPTTAVDPSGHGALIERALLSGVVGAGIGAGVGAILCQHGATYSKCVLRNTLLGLVSGLAGGLVPVGGFAGACAAGAVGSGTAAAVGGLADGNLDLGDVAKQAAIGCGIGGVTYGAGKAVFGKTPTEPKEPEPSTGEPSSPGGSLTIIGNSAQYSASEIRSAQYLRSQGYDVVLRPPTGIRAGGNTSDLLVNDKQYDVYTPVTTNVRNIISNIAAKGTQVHGGGVVVDLSESTLPASALQDVLAQVQEETSRVSDVIVIPPAGAP